MGLIKLENSIIRWFKIYVFFFIKYFCNIYCWLRIVIVLYNFISEIGIEWV